jgi:hypothetical protein
MAPRVSVNVLQGIAMEKEGKRELEVVRGDGTVRFQEGKSRARREMLRAVSNSMWEERRGADQRGGGEASRSSTIAPGRDRPLPGRQVARASS